MINFHAPARESQKNTESGTRTCSSCGRPLLPRAGKARGHQGARGRCSTCDSRWRKAGCPPGGPPPPLTHAERTARSAGPAGAASKAARDRRLAEYAASRELGFPVAMAAADAGVSEVTGWRYERLLKTGRRQAA
jgi:hypothetical protein